MNVITMNRAIYNKSKRLLMFTAALCLSHLIGCSDGSLYKYAIDYVPDIAYPSENTISLLRQIADSDDILRLGVNVREITNGDIHGIYFDVVYRGRVMEYIGYDEGELFEDYQDVFFQIGEDAKESDRLVVGVTLSGSEQISDADAVLLYLKFKPRRVGICPFTYERTGIVNGNGSKVTGVAWLGGYASVTD